MRKNIIVNGRCRCCGGVRSFRNLHDGMCKSCLIGYDFALRAVRDALRKEQYDMLHQDGHEITVIDADILSRIFGKGGRFEIKDTE